MKELKFPFGSKNEKPDHSFIPSLKLYNHHTIDLQVPQQPTGWPGLYWSPPSVGGAQGPDVRLPAGPPRPAHQDEPADDRLVLRPRPTP